MRAGLPPGLVYLATDGRDVVWLALGLCLATLFLARTGAGRLVERAFAALARLSQTAFALGLTIAAFIAAVALMPGLRWNAPSFGGDEPKYLRIAQSLLHDQDVDVASQTDLPWSATRFTGGLLHLAREARDEVLRLFAPTPVPEGHQWNLGNWTLAGLHGGHYYVQSPGLPIVLLPALVIQPVLAPDRPESFFPLLTLTALWAFGVTQTVLLASDLSSSRAAGVAAGLLGMLSAPLLVGGFHFYPESAAVALVPWLLREAARATPPGRWRSLVGGVAAAFLPWLHPKFTLLSVVLLLAVSVRARKSRTAFALLLAGATLVLLPLLLYDHNVTGLLTPDALYRRYGASVYSGIDSFLSPLFWNGLVTALFGARDGLFVIAPVFLIGALSTTVAWRRDQGLTLLLLATFASLWIAAAVHEGGAPGPPGRLMAPVACVLSALTAIGLVAPPRRTGFLLTAALLSTLTLQITAGMLFDWRRTVNPYRDVFSDPSHDFAKDLPDGPGRPESSRATDKASDLARGLLLLAILGFWAARFGRPDVAPRPLRYRVAAWGAAIVATVAIAATGLAALGP